MPQPIKPMLGKSIREHTIEDNYTEPHLFRGPQADLSVINLHCFLCFLVLFLEVLALSTFSNALDVWWPLSQSVFAAQDLIQLIGNLYSFSRALASVLPVAGYLPFWRGPFGLYLL